MNFIRNHRIELFLLALSLAVHLVTFFLALMVENGDVLAAVRADDGYFELAQNVLAGNGFSWSSEAPYAPNPLRTPGYVYVLAELLGGVGVTGAALIQLVAASAIPLLGMYVARALTDSRGIGILTGFMLALDPTLAILSFQFYTDTLFLLLFLPWLLFTLRYLKHRDTATLVASALFLGAAILVRPVVQYIPLLLVPFILWKFNTKEWRRGAAHVGLYLVVIGTLLTPWTLRNIQVFEAPGLSAQTPFVLYTNLAPAILSVANGSDFLAERDAFLTREEYGGDAITLANGSAYTEKALDIVRMHPDAAAFVMLKSLFTFFTNDGFYAFLARIGHTPADFLPLLIVMRLVWIGITLAAFVGAVVYLFTKRSLQTILILLLVAYFALTSTIAAFGTNPRYRLPVDPIIIVLAVSALSIGLKQIHRLPFLPIHKGETTL